MCCEGNSGVSISTGDLIPLSETQYLTLEEVATLVLRLELRLEHGGLLIELLVVFSRERFFFAFASLFVS